MPLAPVSADSGNFLSLTKKPDRFDQPVGIHFRIRIQKLHQRSLARPPSEIATRSGRRMFRLQREHLQALDAVGTRAELFRDRDAFVRRSRVYIKDPQDAFLIVGMGDAIETGSQGLPGIQANDDDINIHLHRASAELGSFGWVGIVEVLRGMMRAGIPTATE